MAAQAREILGEIEDHDGMAAAIEAGLPMRRIEEAAAGKQARIDSGEDVIVGVNKYQAGEPEAVELLQVQNTEVRQEQVERLARLRSTRDRAAVTRTLEALRTAARRDEGNLLELSIQAIRARATVGEVSSALEDVYGRHQGPVSTVRGVYASGYADDRLESIQARVERFAERVGRRPRMLVVKLGQDGHNRGAKVVVSAFADLGFDVDLGPLFSTPAEAARHAIENDVHVIGVSSLAAGHRVLVPELLEELQASGAQAVAVVVGGVVPPADVSVLEAAGVAAVFPPGTPIPDAADVVLDTIEAHAS